MQGFSEEFLQEAKERQEKRLMEATRQYAEREIKYHIIGQELTQRDRELTIRDIARHIGYASVPTLDMLRDLWAGQVFSVEQREQIVREVLAENKEAK